MQLDQPSTRLHRPLNACLAILLALLACQQPWAQQTDSATAEMRLGGSHRVQTSLWNRCYAQHRGDASRVLARELRGPGATAYAGEPLLGELPEQQRQRNLKSAQEELARAVQFAQGGQRAGVPQLFRPNPQGRSRQDQVAGPMDLQAAEMSQALAVKASAQILGLTNDNPRAAQYVADALGAVLSGVGPSARQETACMHLIADLKAHPRPNAEVVAKLTAILQLRPETLQTHPMYGRATRNSAQPLSCAIGLAVVPSLLAEDRVGEAAAIVKQVSSAAHDNLRQTPGNRVAPAQLDCGYFSLLEGNLHLMGLGGPVDRHAAGQAFQRCVDFIDACALNWSVVQLLTDQSMTVPAREIVARTLQRAAQSPAPDVSRRAQQLLRDRFSADEQAQAAMGPLERQFSQFISLAVAVHQACQADPACRARAQAMANTASSSLDDMRERSAQAKRDDESFRASMRSGYAAATGRGDVLGCHTTSFGCKSGSPWD